MNPIVVYLVAAMFFLGAGGQILICLGSLRKGKAVSFCISFSLMMTWITVGIKLIMQV